MGFGLRPEVVRGTAGRGVQRTLFRFVCPFIRSSNTSSLIKLPPGVCRLDSGVRGVGAAIVWGVGNCRVSQPRAPHGGCGRGLGCVSGLRSVCHPGKGFQPPWEAAQCARITLALKV